MIVNPLRSMITFTLLCLAIALGQSSSLRAQIADNAERITPPDKSWIVYYANKHKSSDFIDYDIIVFDRQEHPPIQNLKAQGKILLGYVSGGEAEKYRDDFKAVKQTHALMEENPNWPGHFAVDVRNPEWTRYIVEDVIPRIVQKGFHGIFIDTLDTVEDLEVRNPTKYKGMIEGAARMVKTIRLHYPNLKIMINRGFKVMPYIAQDVDYVLAEGSLVNYDFEGNGNHTFFEDEIYQEYIDMMQKLKKQAPHLQLMTLDYWDMEDTQTVKKIYERHRKSGFLPYVTTLELDRVDREPK